MFVATDLVFLDETRDTYGHLFPEARQETTSALDRLFGAC